MLEVRVKKGRGCNAPMHFCTYALLHSCIFASLHVACLHYCNSAFCIPVMYQNQVKEKSMSGTSSYTKRAVHRHIRNERYIARSGTSSYTKHHIRKERYIVRSSTSSYMKRAVHHHIRKERYIIIYKRVGKELRDTVGFVSFSISSNIALG